MNNFKILLGFVVLLLMIGCRDDIEVTISENTERVGDEDNWVVYMEETKEVDQETKDALVAMKDDLLIFSEMTDQLEEMESGDILNNNTINDITPYGYLRRVISKEMINDQVLVRTEEAPIEEAFEEFSFNWSGAFKDVSAKSTVDGFFDGSQFKFPTDSIFVPVNTSNGPVNIGVGVELNVNGDLVVLWEKVNGVTHLRLGVDRFSFEQSKFGVSFGSAGLTFEESVDPIESLYIPVGAVPLGPVVVRGDIEFRGFFSAVANIQGFAGFEFSCTPFRSIMEYDGSRPEGQQYTYESTETNWRVVPKAGVQGTLRKELGFGIGLGFSPYAKSVATLGAYVDTYSFMQLDVAVNTSCGEWADGISLADLATCIIPSGDGCLSMGIGVRPGIYGGSQILGSLPVVGQYFGNASGIDRLPLTQFEKILFKGCVVSGVPTSSAGCDHVDGFQVFNYCANGKQMVAIIPPPGVNVVGEFEVVDAIGQIISNSGITTFAYNQSVELDATGFDIRSLRVRESMVGAGCERTFFLTHKNCENAAGIACAENIVDDRDFITVEYCAVDVGDIRILRSNVSYLDRSLDDAPQCYIEDANSCEELGRLYNFENAQNACPEGYSLPSVDDWQNLINLTKSSPSGPPQIHKLMAQPSGNITNFLTWDAFKTNLLLSGFYVKWGDEIGEPLGPQGLGEDGYYWAATQVSPTTAWAYHLKRDRTFEKIKLPITFGASCRCVKD